MWGDGGGENGLGPCRLGETYFPYCSWPSLTVCMSYSIDDGLVEVFAVYSSLHIARLQVSLAEPHRLGQARTVRVCVCCWYSHVCLSD